MDVYYKISEYRANRNQPDIVYYSESARVYIRVTKEQFLAENPGLTAEDFEFFKKWSDDDLRRLYNNNRQQGLRHTSIDQVEHGNEDALLNGAWIHHADLVVDIELILTEVEHRRLVLHDVYGYTTKQIAALDNCSHVAIVRSIANARKKLKQYLNG